MIRIDETDTEYLLSIPIDQKERAKKIVPRKWDPERTVWVYPKTKTILEQLIAEFGDGNTKIFVKQKILQDIISPRAAIRQEETELLKKQLDEIQRSVEKISIAPPALDNPLIQNLNQQIDSLKLEISNLNQQLVCKDEYLTELNNRYQAAQEQITNLRETLANQILQPNNRDLFIKEKAKEATSNDPKFCRILDNHNINENLLIEISNKMSLELKFMTNNNDSKATLSDLISQSFDAELLTQEASDFAHLIRKERNKIVHGNVYKKTNEARILMCIFAASLLWPYFRE